MYECISSKSLHANAEHFVFDGMRRRCRMVVHPVGACLPSFFISITIIKVGLTIQV